MSPGRPARSKEKAKELGIMGWNIRCNLCGDFGARWIHRIHGEPARRGFGALALCPLHAHDLAAERERHAGRLIELTRVNFEQET